MKRFFYGIIFCLAAWGVNAAELLVEAESFDRKEGWGLDQQAMDVMGSPYLIAHGLGYPVHDAYTEVEFPEKGVYHAYVRTFNWTSPWHKGEGPGKFYLAVDGKRLPRLLGATGDSWEWQYAGEVKIGKLYARLSLQDQTGLDGRCDAIYFTTAKNQVPPSGVEELAAFRKKMLKLPAEPEDAGTYDLVVVGAGVAGMCAATAASRLGLKVALIQDRPFLGGNSSHEIHVGLGGKKQLPPYPNVGNLVEEFCDHNTHYVRQKLYFAPHLVTLYLNCRATKVEMNGNIIVAVIAKHTENSKEFKFKAKLFADCTGDAVIGAAAGADYYMGRESKATYNEKIYAPDVADKRMMGSTIAWFSVERSKPTSFPVFKYGMNIDKRSYIKATTGAWNWEVGFFLDPILEVEKIRDQKLLAIYSNWSYLKNEYKDDDTFARRDLTFTSYVVGKRESRRLMGDLVLTENDIVNHVLYNDGCVTATWPLDVHFPDSANARQFPGMEFLSRTMFTEHKPYPIPYRCFYSRNIDNLFMAGRDISTSHAAMGATRLQKTCGMMGEVVGMAASVCIQKNANPRGVYTSYFEDLKALMNVGVGITKVSE